MIGMCNLDREEMHFLFFVAKESSHVIPLRPVSEISPPLERQ